MSEHARIGLVLAGGAARGAYEVGVIKYVLEEIGDLLGPKVRFDVLCGTSVGAINACFLAATAERGRDRARLMCNAWSGLRIEEIVRFGALDLFAFVRESLGILRGTRLPIRRGGLIDPLGLRLVVERVVPFRQISANVADGFLEALTVSTTHVASGVTMVFVERRGGGIPKWGRDPTVMARPAQITADHALASGAIPFLFPAVRLGGEYHCDGGLRQNVPLGPARRLGAERVLIVSPRYAPMAGDFVPPALAADRQEALPSAFFLLGKALNALLLDRVENDVDRLRRINDILDAGMHACGPGFLDALNLRLGAKPARPMRAMLVRCSRDIGRFTAEYVRSRAFSRDIPGPTGWVLRWLADREAPDEADLLSYLLFDGHFASELIQLGFEDARSQHDRLVAFFEGYPI